MTKNKDKSLNILYHFIGNLLWLLLNLAGIDPPKGFNFVKL